ncbi:hypothetical protein BO99DRAFT_428104 [Aspergillus violaceofuscus CBS 115571]|uniref:Uncharacterized protein n=1 Tax=Aspergillus violaceofuscus (strain CBS 115571) TaxID=1450538 RepID=A0A2V5IWA5_ASPV1|nr:hypothetical protein BO99DRAFT_428104 [Aspergillus violaceofuscus CBS 115571]
MSVITLPAGAISAALLKGLNSEHVIDKQVKKSFVKAALTGYLESGAPAGLLPVSETFWATTWHAANSDRGAMPPVGGAAGASPNTPHGRAWRPLGHTFTSHRRSETAVKADSEEAADDLLTAIQSGFVVVEYFRDNRVVGQWNNVLQRVGLQWAHVEQATGVSDLQNWWWVWAPDLFQVVENNSHDWAVDAIRAAAGAYTAARTAGRDFKTNDMVIQTLSEFESKIQKMEMPTIYADRTTITD